MRIKMKIEDTSVIEKIENGFYDSEMLVADPPKPHLKNKEDITEVKVYIKKLEEYNNAAAKVKAQNDEIIKRSNAKNGMLKKDILEDAGIAGHPKADILWNMARERCRGEGFMRLYNEVVELAELLK